MLINEKQENGTIILMLKGRLDTITSQQFQDALIPAFDKAKEIKLDFAGVEYISSAGLRVLSMGHRAAKTKDIPMVLTNISDKVMEVFDITGFTDQLTIV